MIRLVTCTIDVYINIATLPLAAQGSVLHLLEQTDLQWQTPSPAGGIAHYHLEIIPGSVLWLHQLTELLRPFDVDFGYSTLQEAEHEAAN